MSFFDPNDYISCQSWERLCDHGFDRKNIPPSGTVFCPLEHIHEFFVACGQTANRYVLVSASSDYGLHEQNIDHPNADLWKMATRIDFGEVNQHRDNYLHLPLGPCCDTNHCLPSDTYSVKYYNYTKSTFSVVPTNVVKWFCTNVNIKHPVIQAIPFGLNDEGNITSVMAKHIGRPKKGLLYVNFQPHTHQRARLLNHFSQQSWATVKTQVPVDEFWQDISEHEFVLCPFGNGLDCYRTLETIYLGSIPIIEGGVFASHFAGLFPFLAAEDLSDLHENLQEVARVLREQQVFASDKLRANLRLSTWKKLIDEARQLLKTA